jgi:hypothetical protein
MSKFMIALVKSLKEILSVFLDDIVLRFTKKNN